LQTLAERLDEAIAVSFPFIRNPLSHAIMPFKTLCNRYKKGSEEIVISIEKRDLQYTCYLRGFDTV